jgi:hypothetical protein
MRDVKSVALEGHWSFDAPRVGEALRRRIVDDHAGRSVGAAPDRGAIGPDIAGLDALQETRPARGGGLGEELGWEGGEGTGAQKRAPS